MVERAPLRVAFVNIPRRLWAGGHNYLRNLFAALNRYQPGAIVPVLFAGMNDDADEIAAFAAIPDVEIIRSAAFDRVSNGLLAALTIGLDGPAAAEFRAHDIDLVFESARFYGWRLRLPAIAWFPDFQHRRLPHLFSAAARLRRDFGFRVQIGSGRRVMLSSASASQDLRQFYGEPTGGVSIVRFATEPPSASLETNPQEVIAHYRLPARYFYLPNQFWRHKNHRAVIDALAILRQRGLDLVVAASGGTEDPREPGYFDGAMRQVKMSGLESNFRHLGMIPLDHVYALLRASTALINPSECEGWSTTVEEAKSFGVPMILSDIDVHREQTEGSARYFATTDPEALANHMAAVMEQAGPAVVRNLQPNVEGRVRAFAGEFVSLTQEVMRSAQPRGQSG